jgi:hypothetical protein
MVQSNYIPWKGYFDIIARVDEFVLFDDVQYTRRDWRNRNRIKTAHGPQWLSVPVNSKGKYLEPIKEITISDPGWKEQHWKSIVSNYSRARHFDAYMDTVRRLYLECDETHLSRVNYRFIVAICEMLGIRTQLSWSMDYKILEGPTQRIVGICEQAGATEYVSGPSARGYMDEDLFRIHGIDLTYMEYSGYPEYQQLFPPFVHEVSALDLIFNEGSRAREFLHFT